MKWQSHISQNSAVMGGKPVIKGTRITVAHILELLGNGWPAADILDSCPGLTAEDIQAAQAYAAAYIEMEETVFFHGDSLEAAG
jgi:uncharacterized protein (DUF433 family)